MYKDMRLIGKFFWWLKCFEDYDCHHSPCTKVNWWNPIVFIIFLPISLVVFWLSFCFFLGSAVIDVVCDAFDYTYGGLRIRKCQSPSNRLSRRKIFQEKFAKDCRHETGSE